MKKSLIICLVFILISTNIFIVNAETFKPNTIYVDDVPGEGLNNPPEDFTNIQDAIDAANNGDTVYVYSGFYQLENNDQHFITISKPINFIGENKNTTILDADNQDDCLYINSEHKDEVLISGFTFQNARYGLRIIGEMTINILENIFTNFTSRAIIIQETYCNIFINSNQFFDNFGGIAVYSEEQNPYVEISQNIISNNKYGILISSNNVVIKENIISNNKKAIGINDVQDCTIINNHIIDNKLGFSYIKSWCSLVNNNFINNEYDYFISAGIFLIELPFLVNKHIWSGNYWDNWKYNLPKPIAGTFVIALLVDHEVVPIIVFPLIFLDKNPAKEPFNISGI